MSLVTCIAHLESASPYSQSQIYRTPRETGEPADAHENRCRLEMLHVDEASGHVIIPRAVIKNMLVDTAKFLAESVPGKGKATWTKHFEAGLFVMNAIDLGITPEQVEWHRLFLNADGRKGGGTRVWKLCSRIFPWQGSVRVTLADPQLQQNPNKVAEYFAYGGDFVGIGRWRPRKGGENGRFKLTNFEIVGSTN